MVTLTYSDFVHIAAFITTPTSVNATLGSTATFTCSATTGLLGWIVNGSPITELNETDITTSSDRSIFALHIPATEEHNNTNVLCSVYIHGMGLQNSAPVVFRVQGVL